MDIKSFDSLFARLEDLKKCAIRGNLGISAFFSPREIHASEEYLKRGGTAFISFGGYFFAERRRIYLLPDFMESVCDATEIIDYGFSSDIDALLIKGSGFEELSHRAVMGSILGLGVERDVVGDIVMLDEHRAVVFCDSKMSAFFIEGLLRVGRDKVSVERIELDEAILPAKKTVKINDTVASSRLDCVVAALCSLSRERAKERIGESLVELDYETVERPDKEVSAPAVISVRGVGKFSVISLGEKTKKGRMRLVAEKYL